MKEVNSVSDATNTYGEDIKLTTTDASTLYKTIITELEKGAGEPLYPGDERRIFGEALVPVFVALYNSLNDVGRRLSAVTVGASSSDKAAKKPNNAQLK